MKVIDDTKDVFPATLFQPPGWAVDEALEEIEAQGGDTVLWSELHSRAWEIADE